MIFKLCGLKLELWQSGLQFRVVMDSVGKIRLQPVMSFPWYMAGL